MSSWGYVHCVRTCERLPSSVEIFPPSEQKLWWDTSWSHEQRAAVFPLSSLLTGQSTVHLLKTLCTTKAVIIQQCLSCSCPLIFFSPTLILELCRTLGVLTVPPFYTRRAGRWAIQDDAAGAVLLLVLFVWRNHDTLRVPPITQCSSIQHRLFNHNTRQCDISSHLLITLSSSNRVKVLNVWLSKQWDPVL